MKLIKPESVTISGDIRRPGSREKLLGYDMKGYLSFVTSRLACGETDLFGQTFERGLFKSAGGTVNPDNFGNPKFNLNCVLAHYAPFMCLTDSKTCQQVDDARTHEGKFDLRLVIPLYEISGNQPHDSEYLTELRYRELNPKQDRMRTLLRIASRATRHTRWDDLGKPKIENPYKLHLAGIRNRMLNEFHLDRSYVERLIPFNTTTEHAPAHQPALMSA